MVQAVKLSWPASALLILALLTAASGTDIVLSDCSHFPYNKTNEDPNSTVVTLLLTCCNITDITASDLEDLRELKRFIVTLNQLEYLDLNVLAAIPKIKELNLNSNKLKMLPVFGANSVIPNVEIIQASHNSITKLDDPRTFASTKQLKVLRLNNNEIEFIHSDMFLGLEYLEGVYFHINKLTSIDDRVFAIKSLKYVHLERNLINNVALGAFRGSQLQTLYLDGNRLTHLYDDLLAGPGAHIVNFCYDNNPWRADELITISTFVTGRNMSCPFRYYYQKHCRYSRG